MTLKLSNLNDQVLLDCNDGKIRTKEQLIAYINQGNVVTDIYTVSHDILRAMTSDSSYEYLKSINHPILSVPDGEKVEVDITSPPKEIQERNALVSEITSGGDFDKFLVFKIDDVRKYLGEAAYTQLCHTLAHIASVRKKEGKKPCNTHLVVNIDEAYAPQIVDILKQNGHWG